MEIVIPIFLLIADAWNLNFAFSVPAKQFPYSAVVASSLVHVPEHLSVHVSGFSHPNFTTNSLYASNVLGSGKRYKYQKESNLEVNPIA